MIYNVLIYDEMPIICIGLREVIKAKFPLCDVYIAKDAEEFLKYSTILTFELIFVDISKNGFNQFSLLVKIKKVQPSTKLILFSFFDNVDFKIRSFKYGADAIFKKKCSEQNVHQVIDIFLFGADYSRNLMKESFELKTKYRKIKSDYKHVDSLSLREYELALLIISGEKVRDIASSLDIASSTVCTYKKRIFFKTNTKNVLQLAHMFNSHGIGLKK